MTIRISHTLLQPDNHAVILIDHQYLQFITMQSSNAGNHLDRVMTVHPAGREARRT